MAHRKLHTVLGSCVRSMRECRTLAADAYRWSSPALPGQGPSISTKRRDSMTELAFLRAFLAWEAFLERSFVLYLSGQRPPRGRAPHRYAFPPNQAAAKEWVLPESRAYAEWTVATKVSARAERFFRDGRPFAPLLRGNQHLLDEARVIRNAITHESESAREKFDNVVRTKLGTLPPSATVGGFLVTIVPKSAPPLSFLDFYLDKIQFLAHQIVPT